jgi:hypothetical protein
VVITERLLHVHDLMVKSVPRRGSGTIKPENWKKGLVNFDNGATAIIENWEDLLIVHNPQVPGLGRSRRLHAAWLGNPMPPPTLSACSVALRNGWRRNSSYRRITPVDKTLWGTRFERIFRRRLERAGLIVQSATDYEDEQLSVDFWVLLLNDVEERQWYPIDVSTRTGDRDTNPHRKKSKYNRVFQRGAISVPASDRWLDFMDRHGVVHYLVQTINQTLDDFSQCEPEALTRERAMDLELRNYPNHTAKRLVST